MKLLPWRRGPSTFTRAADGSMPLLEHVLELRTRLFKASVAVAAGMIVGYVLSLPVFDLLKQPYCDLQAGAGQDGCGWNVLAPTDDFLLRLKIALWVGLLISAPFWLYQLWAFIAPGLHRRERRWAYGFSVLAVPLFAAGASLAYFVLDKGLQFLAEVGVTQQVNQFEPIRYISFITTLILVFGLSFQFPVLVLLLNFSGLVSARKLIGAWRVVVFLCFAFAAVFTPDPGPFGMMLLAACLCALYFLAVGVAFLNDRRRAKQRDPLDDLPDDEISPLGDGSDSDEELEPVAAGEGIDAVLADEQGSGADQRPHGRGDGPSRRYDDLI